MNIASKSSTRFHTTVNQYQLNPMNSICPPYFVHLEKAILALDKSTPTSEIIWKSRKFGSTESYKNIGSLKRISSRRTSPRQKFLRDRVVFEGHGICNLPIKKIKVPPATTITLYTGLNCTLSEDVAKCIAKGQKLPNSLRYRGTNIFGYHDAEILGGRSYLTGHRRTYYEGEMVPNYLLYPPSEYMNIGDNSVTTTKPTFLKTLLLENKGKDCHWASCTAVRFTKKSPVSF